MLDLYPRRLSLLPYSGGKVRADGSLIDLSKSKDMTKSNEVNREPDGLCKLCGPGESWRLAVTASYKAAVTKFIVTSGPQSPGIGPTEATTQTSKMIRVCRAALLRHRARKYVGRAAATDLTTRPPVTCGQGPCRATPLGSDIPTQIPARELPYIIQKCSSPWLVVNERHYTCGHYLRLRFAS